MKAIKLKTPIKYGEQEIKELSFREPLCGDLKGINLSKLAEGDAEQVLKLACNLQAEGEASTGAQSTSVKLPIGFFESLPLAEFSKLAGIIGEYLGE